MALPADILAEARLLLIRFQLKEAEAAGLSVSEPAPDSPNGAQEPTDFPTAARRLCDAIKDALPRAEAGDITALLDSYHLLYPLAEGHPAPRRLADLWRDRLYRAWTADPASVPESAIYTLLRPLLKTGKISGTTEEESPKTGEETDQVLALLALRHRWLEALSEDAPRLEPSAELYRRLALLTADSSLPLELKRHWWRLYGQPLAATLTTNDSRLTTMEAQRAYINSLPEEILTFEERLALDNRLITSLLQSVDSQLTTTQDLALRLTLTYNFLLIED